MNRYCDELGIPDSYGRSPPLTEYQDAEDLVVVGPNIIGREQRLTPQTAAAWQDMLTAAAEDDVRLLIVSGFRSIADQALLIAKKMAAGQSLDDILKVNTAPGFSQHHTGRAIDIATPGVRPLTEDFAESAAFRWLEVRAESFGFTMPYDRDNALGITYEPWHWYLTEDPIEGHSDAAD